MFENALRKEFGQPRDIGLDFLRAWATFLVVVGHAIQFANPDFDRSWAFKVIYAFHMPLFMCISGYVAPQLVGRGVIGKKFKQLVIPFLIWTALVFMARYFADGGYLHMGFDGLEAVGQNLLGVLRTPDSGLWFLWILFLNFCVFAIFNGRYLLPLSFAFVISLYLLQSLSTEFSYYGLNLIRWHYPFFILGVLIRDGRVLAGVEKFFWVLFVLTVIALTQWDRNLVTVLFGVAMQSAALSKAVTLVIKLLAAVGVILILFLLKERVRQLGQFLGFLSDQSLGYYGAQTLVFVYATMFLKTQVSVFLFTFVVCTVLVFLLNKNRFLRRFLLGKV